LSSRSLFAILLFVALTALLVARGIAPPMIKVGSDFPGYFTSAKIVADGGSVDRLYDNAWFQDQMRRYRSGDPSYGKFAPFPPPTALLLVPLTPLSALDALRVMTVISVLCLAGSIVLLARILSWPLLHSATFILLSGVAVQNGLRFGQPYIVLETLCLLGYYAYLKGWPLAAGICFGLFVPIKYFPVVFLLYFAWRRQWRVLLGGALAVVAVVSLSVSVLGFGLHEQWFSSVIGNHLIGRLSMQDPFTASFQSFDSLFRQLFVNDASLNPHPLAALPLLDATAVIIVKTALVLAAAAALLKLARTGATAPSIGIISILTLLIAPATATYHFVLLWLPVGLMIQYFLANRAPVYAAFLVCTYALIGFFPYALTARFDGRGALAVLAYPRLLLLLSLFAGCLHFIWGHPQSERPRNAAPIPGTAPT
jgi:alpha-1,2-mannosyltransferase